MLELNEKFLNEINEKYSLLVPFFSKEDMQDNLDRRTFREKMLGFLTPEYFKRVKLFENGPIVYGYIYRSFHSANETDIVQVWVLTSPEHYFLEDPLRLGDVSAKLSEIVIGKKVDDKKVSLFISRILEPYAELKYVEIPATFTDGHLAFMSTVVFHPNHVTSFRHGLNLFLSNPRISKEMLLLPEKYWPEEYLIEYYGKTE